MLSRKNFLNKNKYLQFISFFLVFLFNGCLNYEETLNLNRDFSGTLTIHYWISDLDNNLKNSNKDLAFSEEKIKEELSAEGVKIENIEVFQKDNEKHAKIILKFNHIMDLNKTKYFEDDAFELREGASGQYIFDRKIGGSLDYFNVGGYKHSFYYLFPTEIITDNSQTKVGDYLKWEFDTNELVKRKTLSVTFKAPGVLEKNIYWIIIILIVILLLTLILWRSAILKKKKQNEMN